MKKRGKAIALLFIILILTAVVTSVDFNNLDTPDYEFSETNSYYIIEFQEEPLIVKETELNDLADKNEKIISESSSINPLKYGYMLFSTRKKDVPEKVEEHEEEIVSEQSNIKDKIREKLSKSPRVVSEYKNVLNGVVYFTPELPGRYRFDIKEFNMIIGTTQADAVVFAKPGFAFPLADLLSSEIVEEVYKETKTEQVQVPLEKDKMIYKPTTIFKKDNKIKLEKNLLIHTCVLVIISIGSVIFVLITRKKK